MRFAALLAVLLTAKALALAGHHLPRTAWAPIAFLWHDAAVALAFVAIEAAVLSAFARSAPARPRRTSTSGVGSRAGRARATPRCAAGIAFAWSVYGALVAYVVVNVPVIRVLATPMTRPMWRAARGPLADSILRYATVDTLLACALVAAVGVVAPVVFHRVQRIPRHALMAASILAVALGPMAAARVETNGLERNAWTALIATTLPPATIDGSSATWNRTGFERTRDEDLTSLRGAAAGRNVVLVSLESAGAQYLGLYGAHPDAMPNLSRLAQQAIVFDHAYAVYPESIKGLYTLLCSACPALDSDVVPDAEVRCSSIADLLARRGYRTALFHSGRFGYLGMDAVVRGRGYDMLADAGDIGGQHQSSFGVDEPSTVARILRWIDERPARRRFFVTYLPVAGHHPYETPEPGPYDDRDEQGRYLNALNYADASLGLLMGGLESRGLANDVLWIVAGDHGEAFGQHDGNYGHTFYVYEENVHVPLVIAAPGMIKMQKRREQVVSLIDIAPTVAELMGDRAPSAYEGQSMLNGASRMAFFLADYSRRMLGLRDGRLKAILTLDSGRTRLFDLDADPGEQTDRARDYPERVSWYARTLRDWAGAHERGIPHTRDLLASGSDRFD